MKCSQRVERQILLIDVGDEAAAAPPGSGNGFISGSRSLGQLVSFLPWLQVHDDEEVASDQRSMTPTRRWEVHRFHFGEDLGFRRT